MPGLLEDTLELVAVDGETHLFRVDADHYVTVGDELPDYRWVFSHLPTRDWVTTWSGDEMLIIDYTCGAAAA
jgi:hypothetical protein